MEWVDRVNSIALVLSVEGLRVAHACSGVRFRGDDRRVYGLDDDGKLRDDAGRMFRGVRAEPLVPGGFVIPLATVSFTCHPMDSGFDLQCNTVPDFSIKGLTIADCLEAAASAYRKLEEAEDGGVAEED